MCDCCSSDCCSSRKFIGSGIFLLLLCVAFVAIAIVVPSALQDYLNDQILDTQRVVTSNSSKGFSQWSSNSGFPTQYLFVYPFNITNPDDVLIGKKPILAQLGPYKYQWRWHYFDFTWSENEQMVEFFKSESFVFLSSASGKDPSEEICYFPALPYAGVRAGLGEPGDDYWWQGLAFDLLVAAAEPNITGETSPIVRASIHEYIWGFNSTLLKFVNYTVGSIIPVSTSTSVQQNSTSDEEVRRTKVYRDKMFTGKNNHSLLNQCYALQGNHTFKFPDGTFLWQTEDASTVQGTDGLGFDIDLKGFPPQTIFIPELFRHIQFVTNETADVHGITTNVYFMNQTDFDNRIPTYYLNAPSGVSNLTGPNLISVPKSPVPILLSQPLFYGADPYYNQQLIYLNNLTPNLTQHNTFLFVEPHTGLTLKANKRLQVNLQLNNSYLYPKMYSAYVPIVWFEQYADIDSTLADQWQSSVGVALSLLATIPIVAYCLAGIMLLGAGSLFVGAYQRSRRRVYISVPDGINI